MAKRKTNIDWADYTWNPVIGCKFACSYCYAEKWAKRAGISFEPHCSQDWNTPYKIKEASTIFVCSLADLFGNWIPMEWIERVLEVVRDNPQHTFKFLTKNPDRYAQFEFPKNVMLGYTMIIPNQEKVDFMGKLDRPNFLSLEPLMHNMSSINFDGINDIYTGMPNRCGISFDPKLLDTINHGNIMINPNTIKYIEELSK